LFGHADYLRADLPPAAGVDYLIGSDGRVPEADGRFDAVLSTQVLEHVPDSDLYLRECGRLLRPGGLLLISTHGSFPDHGCPHDYRRWTAGGLRQDLLKAGFIVESMQKLTTGERGILFLAEDYLGHLWSSRRTRMGVAMWLFQKWFWVRREVRHRWIDRRFANCRMVDASAHDPLYVCLFAVATKA
jgi:SAM-dependent methyltransferase